jgi:single-strand DNA-binding protein
MLPSINGEFGVVFEPEIRFTDDGRAWVKIRGVAKDRQFNQETKTWEDKGDPTFIDIVVGGKMAENITDSVNVGDTIVVAGRLHQREWEKDGKKEKAYQIRADHIGVGVRFEKAPTSKMTSTRGTADTNSVSAPPVSTDAPF